MERDRTAVLIRGLRYGQRFDFRRYDPQNPLDVSRLTLALYEEHDARIRLVYQDVLQYHLTTALVPGELSFKTRKAALDQAALMIQKIRGVLLPWLGETEGHQLAETEVYEALYRRWVEIWGDPETEEVKARIDKTAQYLLSAGQGGRR